jgi:hypothetical protein
MSAGVLIYLPKDRDPERFCHSGIVCSCVSRVCSGLLRGK